MDLKAEKDKRTERMQAKKEAIRSQANTDAEPEAKAETQEAK